MFWSEHQGEAAFRLSRQPSLGLLGNMSRVVVEDQLDGGVGGIGRIETLEEADELARPMAILDAGVHLAGQQVDAGGGPVGGPADVTLRIDHPDTFKGLINLPSETGDLGAIILEGIQADSGQLRAGILSLFDAGGNVINTTRITGGPGIGGAGGLELHVTEVDVQGTPLFRTILVEHGQTNTSGTIIPLTA